jgi:hypothetical protein
MALMVVPFARMPAQDGTATPPKGGREGIVGTGVGRRPEKIRRNGSFLYYSYRRKGNNTHKPSTAQAGRFLLLFQADEQRDGRLPPTDNRGLLPLPSQRRGKRIRALTSQDPVVPNANLHLPLPCCSCNGRPFCWPPPLCNH